jgi:hypothetical protein
MRERGRPRRRAPITLRTVRLRWYAVALIPIAALVIAPLQGRVPGEVIVVAAFLLFFWLFSFGFAIYAKMRPMTRKRPELRQ